MLNKGVTPVVCQKGSVGASGDLAPMAQVALLLMGEGEAFYEGERLPGRVAMERAGIPIPGLQARDGLAAINGSNLLTAMSALHLYDMDRWLRQAEIACAMTLEALLANMKPYDVRLHELRGFPGAVRSAQRHPEVHRRAATWSPERSRPRCRTPTRCAPRRRSSARPTTRSPAPGSRWRSS